MTEKPDNDNPQNMSADDFFGKDNSKNTTSATDKPESMGELTNQLNEALANSGLSNISGGNIVMQLIINILPLPYSSKRRLQEKMNRGESLSPLDIITGGSSIFSIIKTVIFMIIFAAIAIYMRQQGLT